MHKIDGPGATAANEFTEGNPVAAIPATEVTADWLNTLQREVVAVVEASGQTLDKDDDAQLLQAILSLASTQDGITIFNAAGSQSFTVPEAMKSGKVKPHVLVVGAGGGSAGGVLTASGQLSCGGGGDAGGYALGLLDLTGVNSVPVTIGAGGAAGVGGVSNGGTGGSSSFGSYLSATGGAGGQSVAGGSGATFAGPGNTPGTGAGGSINGQGGVGLAGVRLTGFDGFSGAGGASILSGGGAARYSVGAGSAGILGAGGGGGLSLNGSGAQNGAKGGDGVVIIWW